MIVLLFPTCGTIFVWSLVAYSHSEEETLFARGKEKGRSICRLSVTQSRGATPASWMHVCLSETDHVLSRGLNISVTQHKAEIVSSYLAGGGGKGRKVYVGG